MQSVVIDIVVRCQNVGSVKDSRVRADCGTYYSTIDAAFVFPVSVRSGVGEVPERETKVYRGRHLLGKPELGSGVYHGNSLMRGCGVSSVSY